jgi:hypothetical protein
MDFKQNPKDGSCDLNFSDEEIKIINKHKKIHFSAIALRHFGNCLIRMVAEWNINFNKDIKNQSTNEEDVIKLDDNTSRK